METKQLVLKSREGVLASVVRGASQGLRFLGALRRVGPGRVARRAAADRGTCYSDFA